MKIGKQINLSMNWDGRLNPRFVEQMMGFPLDWTLIESPHSETPSSRKSPNSLAAPSPKPKE
jgi:hypothetical protein